MRTFEDAMEIALGFEGGFVDDPDDRGGATKWGVTQETYDAYRESHDLEARPVREMERDEAEQIYFERYWVQARCPSLPGRVAAAHFDAAVNHGVRQATKLLQRAAGVMDDGIVGPVTLGAVNRADPDRLLEDLYWERVRFYLLIVGHRRSQLKFLRGWIRRVADLRDELRPEELQDAA